jgi:DNA invertase Pin-like site-specific DNA recombinase
MNEEQNVKNVILYFRVSTDEQAKGFSLEYQEEVLNRFCEIKGFNVIKSYKEDESAKDFEGRPEWTKLQNYINGNKNKVDLVLVHKWDRFARDILEAYKMLAIFDGWGVGVNAVEQWLDMSVPESKINPFSGLKLSSQSMFYVI